MISLLGIVIGLALFILLAYMGYNTIIVAIASAMVVAVFGGMNPFVALTEAFMPKTVGFMQGYFLIFLFSALFARFMGDSGAAPSIAVKVARIAKKAKNPDMQRWLAVMVLPLIQLILTAIVMVINQKFLVDVLLLLSWFFHSDHRYASWFPADSEHHPNAIFWNNYHVSTCSWYLKLHYYICYWFPVYLVAVQAY